MRLYLSDPERADILRRTRESIARSKELVAEARALVVGSRYAAGRLAVGPVARAARRIPRAGSVSDGVPERPAGQALVAEAWGAR